MDAEQADSRPTEEAGPLPAPAPAPPVPAPVPEPHRRPGKSLIVCCDGTWMNALGKASKDDPPSNVSRMVRVLKNTTASGTSQVILYHPGVGSSGQFLDASMGGAFGMGLDEDIRELYDFVCVNYTDGDDIVLVGFSRGAFTARSVADLIASVGLLTLEGLDRFYDIFEDYENMGDKHRPTDEYLCPNLEPYRNEDGEKWIEWENRRKRQFRTWLKHNGYTRDTYSDGTTEITIKALGVWDTVGSLGIPAAPFTNTQISRKVEHAFQALALDEPRYDFLPSLWERLPDNTTTNLKQVWFPGAHANVGGGEFDQQIGDITLAWMCDQLASVGVEFDGARMEALFRDGLRYRATHPFPHVPSNNFVMRRRPPIPWARPAFFSTPNSSGNNSETEGRRAKNSDDDNDTPPPPPRSRRDSADCPGKYHHHHVSGPLDHLWKVARPWALGQLRYPTSLLQLAAGTVVRQPGQFVRVDPETNRALLDQPLMNTSERVHACVRVRLACGGLSMDDKYVWTCEGLTGEKGDDDHDDIHVGTPLWRLERAGRLSREDAINAAEVSFDNDSNSHDDGNGNGYGHSHKLYPLDKIVSGTRWHWVYRRPANEERYFYERRVRYPTSTRPSTTVLPEELPTGRWERLLLAMTAGSPDVLAWANANPFPRHEYFR